jgi:hypothetical protein
MGNIERRIERVEAAFAPPISEGVQRVIDGILADAPPPRRATDLAVVAMQERLREAITARPVHPLQAINLAQRIADGRRRIAALEAGEEL